MDELPTVCALGHDLVALLVLRGRRYARRWRQAWRAVVAAGADAWRCAVEVVFILLMSFALAWLVWDATEAQRQADAPSAWSTEGRLEGSLVDTDVTADLEARRRNAPGVPGGGRADEPPSAAVAGGSSSSSSFGGWFMSFVAVSAVLLGGTGVAVVVVRRHRRRSRAPSEQVEVRPLHELPDVLPRDEPEGDADADDAPPSVMDDDRMIDDDEQSTDPLTVDPTTGTTSAAPVASSDTADTTSSSWVSSGVAPTGLFGADSALVVGEAVGSRIETRQRLYERRAAPRVEYVRPGLMLWRGAQRDITVLDLSGTGLRLRVPLPSGPPLPACGDYVQVDFPADGGQVRVTAQVVWRRRTPEGVECGVVFRPLAAEDDERIRSTCMART